MKRFVYFMGAGVLYEWGQNLGGLCRPMADTCGPYKKIIDQICSILPWLLEA